MKKIIIFLLSIFIQLPLFASEKVHVFKLEATKIPLATKQNPTKEIIGGTVGAIAGGAIGHGVASHHHRVLGSLVGGLTGGVLGSVVAGKIGQEKKSSNGIKITYSTDGHHFKTIRQPGRICEFALGEAIMEGNTIQPNHQCQF